MRQGLHLPEFLHRLKVLGALFLTFFSTQAFAAETKTDMPAIWDMVSRVTAGTGYRENILRSSIAEESSVFFNTSADISLMRFSNNGAYLTFFFLIDNSQYSDAPSVDYERFISGTIQAVTPVGEQDEAGAELNYLYQHQVVDLSETQALVTRMLVDGHTFLLRPYWEHSFNTKWAVRFDAEVLRQLYKGDISDYTAPAAEVQLICRYGNRSEISAGYRVKQIDYDSREVFDAGGLAVPGTSLIYQQNEIFGEWKHYWDEERRWRTTSLFGYMTSRDNGSGYFDYKRILFKQQLRWKNPQWEFRTNARFDRYSYPEQTIANEPLDRSSFTLDVHAERRIGKSWLLYAFAEHEWSMGNNALDEYTDWTAGGGAGFEF